MKKGQVFSLDFLLSLALVLLAIGLVIRGIELAKYDQKDEEIYSELRAIAENTGNLLTGNPEINCTVRQLEVSIMNCADTAKINSSNARAKLGIPTEFGFSVINLSATPISAGTQGEKDFAEVKRKVLLHNGDITKQEYNTTFRQQAPAEVSIRVWRE